MPIDPKLQALIDGVEAQFGEVAQAWAALKAGIAEHGDDGEPGQPVLLVGAVTEDSVAVSWSPPAGEGWRIGRSGFDRLGSGPWVTPTPLPPGANNFRFRSLRPGTEYTFTLTYPGGQTSVNATTSTAATPAPAGNHGPRALTAGWVPMQVARDDFLGARLDETAWDTYLDPTSRHGNRQPSQITIVDDPTATDGRCLLITGLPDRRTGGMAHAVNQRFGRWSIRMRADGDYHWHPVPLTWPEAENWPRGGEIDYHEGKCGVNRVEFFLHYSHDGRNHQTSSSIDVDARAWHWWETEWSPTSVKGWCDGRQWFEDLDPSHFNYPEFGPHHGTIQLDHFPDDKPTGTGRMWVDQFVVYRHPAST